MSSLQQTDPPTNISNTITVLTILIIQIWGTFLSHQNITNITNIMRTPVPGPRQPVKVFAEWWKFTVFRCLYFNYITILLLILHKWYKINFLFNWISSLTDSWL
jgi:hypothetical protein